MTSLKERSRSAVADWHTSTAPHRREDLPDLFTVERPSGGREGALRLVRLRSLV
jgi:hypothetical protein